MYLKYTITETSSNFIKGLDYEKEVLTIDFGSYLISYKVPPRIAAKVFKYDLVMEFYLIEIKKYFTGKVLEEPLILAM